MHRNRKDRHRPSQGQRETTRSVNHRRLRLERYEPRLTLSSVSFVQFSWAESLASASTAQGGYIDIATGDFLQSSGNDFVDGQSGKTNSTPVFYINVKGDSTGDLQAVLSNREETFDPWQGPANLSLSGDDAPQNSVSPSYDTSSPTQSAFSGDDDLTNHTTTGGAQQLPDTRIDQGDDRFQADYPSKIRTSVFTRSAEIPDKLNDPFVSVSTKAKAVTNSTAVQLEELYTDLRKTMDATDVEAKVISGDTKLPDDVLPTSEETLETTDQRQVVSRRLMLSTIDGTELVPPADQQVDESATDKVAEGGAIDVAATVNHARTEHEARAFEAVATLLDEQGIVDELTTPPEEQPLVGELARAVALELASFEGTAPVIHTEGAVNRRGAARIEVDAEVPLSHQDAETAQAATSTYAVAPWPLMFRAALGTAIVLWRRKSKSSADPNSGYFEPKDE